MAMEFGLGDDRKQVPEWLTVANQKPLVTKPIRHRLLLGQVEEKS